MNPSADDSSNTSSINPSQSELMAQLSYQIQQQQQAQILLQQQQTEFSNLLQLNNNNNTAANTANTTTTELIQNNNNNHQQHQHQHQQHNPATAVTTAINPTTTTTTNNNNNRNNNQSSPSPGTGTGVPVLPADDIDVCRVCFNGDAEEDNAIIFCDGPGCRTIVHQYCYGVSVVPTGNWYCDSCQCRMKYIGDFINGLIPITASLKSNISYCVLCTDRESIALKPTMEGYWAHTACALFIPETGFRDPEKLDLVIGVDAVDKARWRLHCEICFIRGGCCVQCLGYHCRTSFHVMCGFKAKLRLEMQPIKVDNSYDVVKLVYCDRHKSVKFHPDRAAQFVAQHQNQKYTARALIQYSTATAEEIAERDAAAAAARAAAGAGPTGPIIRITNTVPVPGRNYLTFQCTKCGARNFDHTCFGSREARRQKIVDLGLPDEDENDSAPESSDEELDEDLLTLYREYRGTAYQQNQMKLLQQQQQQQQQLQLQSQQSQQSQSQSAVAIPNNDYQPAISMESLANFNRSARTNNQSNSNANQPPPPPSVNWDNESMYWALQIQKQQYNNNNNNQSDEDDYSAGGSDSDDASDSDSGELSDTSVNKKKQRTKSIINQRSTPTKREQRQSNQSTITAADINELRSRQTEWQLYVDSQKLKGVQPNVYEFLGKVPPVPRPTRIAKTKKDESTKAAEKQAKEAAKLARKAERAAERERIKLKKEEERKESEATNRVRGKSVTLYTALNGNDHPVRIQSMLQLTIPSEQLTALKLILLESDRLMFNTVYPLVLNQSGLTVILDWGESAEKIANYQLVQMILKIFNRFIGSVAIHKYESVWHRLLSLANRSLMNSTQTSLKSIANLLLNRLRMKGYLNGVTAAAAAAGSGSGSAVVAAAAANNNGSTPANIIPLGGANRLIIPKKKFTAVGLLDSESDKSIGVNTAIQTAKLSIPQSILPQSAAAQMFTSSHSKRLTTTAPIAAIIANNPQSASAAAAANLSQHSSSAALTTEQQRINHIKAANQHERAAARAAQTVEMQRQLQLKKQRESIIEQQKQLERAKLMQSIGQMNNQQQQQQQQHNQHNPYQQQHYQPQPQQYYPDQQQQQHQQQQQYPYQSQAQAQHHPQPQPQLYPQYPNNQQQQQPQYDYSQQQQQQQQLPPQQQAYPAYPPQTQSNQSGYYQPQQQQQQQSVPAVQSNPSNLLSTLSSLLSLQAQQNNAAQVQILTQPQQQPQQIQQQQQQPVATVPDVNSLSRLLQSLITVQQQHPAPIPGSIESQQQQHPNVNSALQEVNRLQNLLSIGNNNSNNNLNGLNQQQQQQQQQQSQAQ